MKIVAKISHEWRERMAVVLIFLLGGAAWFFYDGLVSYPAYNEKADAYSELSSVYGADATLLQEKWNSLAIEKGWAQDDVPKHRKNEKQQIQWGTGLLVCAILFLLWALNEMRRKVVSDGEKFLGISTGIPPFSFLVPIKFSSVVGIDKRKWDKKGLAKVFYKTDAGVTRSVLIDDYKYAGSEKILTLCERVVEEKKNAKGN